MSKSLGNFITIHELLETDKFGGRRWPGEVLRLAMLMTHYRQPIDFTVQSLEVAEKVLRQWYRLIGDAHVPAASDWQSEVMNKLGDDLNTPQAIAALHAMSDMVRDGADETAPGSFKHAANLLGLLAMTESEWMAAWNARAQISESEI
jgi:cysteinyl-tRNA synthetase